MKVVNPLVSIIIPIFNRSIFIPETLNSVINQTYSNWEAILVDDGSEDETLELIKNYAKKEKRFRIYKRNREPKGATTCRNIGVEKAEGEYIIFLDSDDLLASFCLKQRIKAIQENPYYDFIVFPILMFKEFINDTRLLWNIKTIENDLYRFLRLDSVWHTTGPIWKKKAVSKLKGFDEKLSCWQDVDIHLRALIKEQKYLVFFDKKPDCFIRKHSKESISQRGFSSKKHLESQKRLLYVIFNLLKINKNKGMFSNLKILCSSIVVRAARNFKIQIGFEIIIWGYKNKLLTKTDCFKLKLICLFCLFRLYKLKSFNLFINQLSEPYITTSNIGKTVYKKELYL